MPPKIKDLDAYEAPKEEIGKESLKKKIGVDTKIHLSDIQSRIEKDNAGKSASEAINPSKWIADQKTIEQIKKVLPKSKARDALIHGLRLRIEGPLNAADKPFAMKAEEKLSLIKSQLLERGAFRQEVEDHKTELLKGGVIKDTGKSLERLGEKLKNLEGVELVLAVGVGIFALTSLYNIFKKEGGKESILKVAARWGALALAGNFVVSGLRKDGKGLFGSAKELFEKTIESTGVKGKVPTSEQLKDKNINLNSDFAEEIMATSNIPLKTTIGVWHANRNKKSISRQELGISSKFEGKLNDKQLFSLVDSLLREYPKNMKPYFKKGSEEEKILQADENDGYRLIEKWYLNDSDTKENMTLGKLWMDYMLDDPPPGRKLEEVI
ncbi:hypothetical protein KJ632_03735 [Patescibacteria group bacterium]|nr:hypothetical protein [Patescibacteria group bacterium]